MIVRLEQVAHNYTSAESQHSFSFDAGQVVINTVEIEPEYRITVEYDPEAGEHGEVRIIVDDECVWSALASEEEEE